MNQSQAEIVLQRLIAMAERRSGELGYAHTVEGFEGPYQSQRNTFVRIRCERHGLQLVRIQGYLHPRPKTAIDRGYQNYGLRCCAEEGRRQTIHTEEVRDKSARARIRAFANLVATGYQPSGNELRKVRKLKEYHQLREQLQAERPGCWITGQEACDLHHLTQHHLDARGQLVRDPQRPYQSRAAWAVGRGSPLHFFDAWNVRRIHPDLHDDFHYRYCQRVGIHHERRFEYLHSEPLRRTRQERGLSWREGRSPQKLQDWLQMRMDARNG